MSVWGRAALLSLGIVVLAYRAGWLSRSGAAAAWVVGWLTFVGGEWPAALTVVAFFLSSSVLSRWRNPAKRHAQQEFAKGGRRDGWQVIANGGTATLGVLLTMLGDAHPLRALIGGMLFLGSLAAATADTWATEVGTLSSQARHILTWKPVLPGTSGGISAVGSMAAFAGGLWIGFVFRAATRMLPVPKAWAVIVRMRPMELLLTCLAAAAAGALVDSVLGATVQRVYFCPACGQETERRVHRCGRATLPRRGWTWVSNDTVNFLGTLSGGIIAVLVAIFVYGYPR